MRITSGVVNSFLVLAVLRFFHGAVSSSMKPLAYSLVSDYFPQDKRSTANSILSGANFVGIALSSMTIILIKNVGWRAAYCTMGGMGLLGALAAFLIVKNPDRGVFDLPLTEEEKRAKEEKERAKAAKPKGFKAFMDQMSQL